MSRFEAGWQEKVVLIEGKGCWLEIDFDRWNRSGADEAGVEGAGEGDVGGALDDGAAIGEEGEGVGRALEAKEKIVEANVSVRGEAVAHGGEVYWTVVLVDLD